MPEPERSRIGEPTDRGGCKAGMIAHRGAFVYRPAGGPGGCRRRAGSSGPRRPGRRRRAWVRTIPPGGIG